MPGIAQMAPPIIRLFDHEIDRYLFDFKVCSSDKGWLQFDTDQDASYFGIWVNKTTREIVTYAEGDITITKSRHNKSFIAEIKDMCEFYTEESHIRTIDADALIQTTIKTEMNFSSEHLIH